MGQKNKPKKMSMKEFMANTPGGITDSTLHNLPSRPKQRTGDDDGSFRRDYGRGGGGGRNRGGRDGGGDDNFGSSEDKWTRGSVAAGGRSGGGYSDRSYGDRNYGGDRNDGDRNDGDRGGGGGDDDNNWRRSGGSGGRYDDRAQYNDRSSYGGGGGGYDRGGGGRYERGGRHDRDGGYGDGPSRETFGFRGGGGGGERRRITLTKRTEPIPTQQPTEQSSGNDITSEGEQPQRNSTDISNTQTPRKTSKPRTNPFGAASAVDTASKLAALELKAKECKEEEMVTKDEAAAVATVIPPTVLETAIVSPEESQEQKVNVNDNQKDENIITTKTPSLDQEVSPVRQGDGTVVDDVKTSEKKERNDRKDRRRRPEPKVVNSRAAALADADADREIPRERERERRRDVPQPRRPPPVLNERFAKLAEEEQNQREEQHHQRRPLYNSRQVMEEETQQGPPSIQNSRFAAAAMGFEAEKQLEMKERDERRKERGGGSRVNPQENLHQGPPPVPTNSRFAAAAADYEMEREMEDRRGGGGRFEDNHGGRGGGYGDDRGGRGGGYGDDRGGRGGGYGDDRGDYKVNHGGGRFGDEHRGVDSGGGNYSGRFSKVDRSTLYPRNNNNVDFPSLPTDQTQTNLTPPELPKHLQNKTNRRSAPLQPPVSAPLTLPGEDEEAAMTRLEKKKRDAEAKALEEKRKLEEEEKKREAEELALAEKATKAAKVEADMLKVFASGDRLGANLKVWCEEQGTILPSVEKLVYHLLTVRYCDHPDANCAWATEDQFGNALLSVVDDNITDQMEVLFAIQRYCHDLGFPKHDDEYLVQAMFRSMYKYDLALEESFSEWKENESTEYEESKGKAIIQTVTWFNWLEEEDEDEDEDEYEENEE